MINSWSDNLKTTEHVFAQPAGKQGGTDQHRALSTKQTECFVHGKNPSLNVVCQYSTASIKITVALTSYIFHTFH